MPVEMRHFTLGERHSDLDRWHEELDEMTDVLMGREDPPMDLGVLTLMEVANAYYSRAAEITAQIQRKEALGSVPRGSGIYKFRTGELRTFMEMAKAAMELGSRRVTVARMEVQDL